MHILSVMQKNLFILLFFCLLAVSCNTTHRVTVDTFPSGLRPWERPYTVDGIRYVPLLHAEGYREEGLASWYGREEHGKPTSNGEVFDMFKPSAAHKTLPLGCYVKVINKTNGKQEIIRVNDRGPFIPGRIIDLSYEAAKELDIVDYGVVPVTIQFLASDYKAPDGVITPAAGAIYTLQVAAFFDHEKARLLSERLKKEFVYTEIQAVQTKKGCIYRVHAGRFRSKDDAQAAKTSFANRGYHDAFIVSDINDGN
jgi:rare lipoprotein A